MKAIRMQSMLLAILTLGSAALASCASGDDSGAVSTTAAVGEQTAAVTEIETTEEDVRRKVSDEIPEMDFEGASFRSITQDSTVNDIWVAGETGDILNDAIYYRNRAVEERFNVKIEEVLAVPYGDISKYVKKSVSAGEDAYDLVIGQMEQSGKDVLGGYFMNWYDLPYVNFSKPWYPATLVEQATINDKMYIIASDMSLSYIIYTYCIYYNKALAQTYDLPDVYALVKNGEWTLEKLYSLSKMVYEDTDNSNDKSLGDTFGLYATLGGCAVSAYFYGIDQPYASIQNNAISMDVNSEKTVDALAVMRDNFFNYDQIWGEVTNTSGKVTADAFVTGKYVFTPCMIRYGLQEIRQSDFEWGILPYPKWDEAQDRYYSAIDAGTSVLTVPTTAQNTEMIGAIVEALSAESWKGVMPTFYDTVMDSKIANDEETVQMLDTVFDSRVIDFAYLYDGWDGWVFKMQKLLIGQEDFASFYAKEEKKVSKHYEKVLDIFLNDLE